MAYSYSAAYPIVKRCVEEGIPFYLRGGPGIGKTTLVHQIGNELGIPVLNLKIAQRLPEDLAGMPIPDRESNIMKWLAPDWTEVMRKNEQGIFFLDELSLGSPAQLAVALEIILEGRIGPFTFPKGWSRGGAGNREEDQSYTRPLGAALSNRMVHLEISADAEEWAEWAVKNAIPEDVIGFLRFRPDLLYKNTGEYAFPSPRSWAMAGKLANGKVTDPDLRRKLVAAAVGESTAMEFLAWSKTYRTIDPAEVLRGNFPEFDKKDASLRYAIAVCVAYYVRKRGIKGYEKQISEFLKFLVNQGFTELSIVFLRTLPAEIGTELLSHPALKSVSSKISEVLYGKN